MADDSKHPGRAAPDIHAVIREAADELRRRPAFGLSDASKLHELAALLLSARAAVADAAPKSFEFHGRPYYLRVRMALQLEVFDAPGDSAPLVCGASLSMDEHGHVPGH